MADPLKGLDLTDQPLVKVIDLLAAMSTLPITLDADALEQRGVWLRDRVSLHLSDATLGDALQAAIARKGLAVIVEGGQVLVTSPADDRETLRKVRYTISDLTGDNRVAATELAGLVRKLVAPESWHAGRGRIEIDDGALAITQTGNVHRQVLSFCEKLRNAREKPLRSRENPDRFSLVTRRDKAGSTLDRRSLGKLP